jgi:hypothetical protein
MTRANRMGQAAKHVFELVLGSCGGLLIFLAIMTLPCPSQAAAWLAAPAASAITAR